MAKSHAQDTKLCLQTFGYTSAGDYNQPLTTHNTTDRLQQQEKRASSLCHVHPQGITSPIRKSSIMSNTRGGCCGPWKPAVASPPAFLRMARPPGCSST